MSRTLLVSLSIVGFFSIVVSSIRADQPELVSVKKIWDRGEHNAFTDLARFRDRWWCTFREAEEHGASIGKVRVITSEDGEEWTSAAIVEEAGIDLRDPKLSVMPDGRLLLVMGGSVYDGDVYRTRTPRVSFSPDGHQWTEPEKVLAEDHWLWRVTWHDGWAWSVSKLGEGRNPRRGMLYRSRDGLDWEWITEFHLPNKKWNASETTLRFMPDGEMIALTRPEWIGTSKPPYTKWNWTNPKDLWIGGPNFVRLPNDTLWAVGRRYGKQPSTVLARLTRDSYQPVLTLPSGGDCSYPGMVWHDELLWMSYYSSHEGKTSIYLAKIKIP